MITLRVLGRNIYPYSRRYSTKVCIVDPQCDPDNPRVLTFEQISTAAFNVRDGIQRTECRHSFRLSQHLDMDLFLKMELNQVTGSFKERGARWALLKLSDEQKRAGVWAASAGNHALALCYHGRQLGVPVNVVMPRHAPLTKIDFCTKLGANVIVQGNDISVARELALQKAYGPERASENTVYINGYDQLDILAGAGTVGLEIVEQVPSLDAVLVPVGGGGLIAGVAVALKTLFPKIQIIGVESETCNGFANALRHGTPTFTRSDPTLADGLAVPVVGVNAFETTKGLLDKMVRVSESSIALAILRLVEWEKVVPEGAGAVGIAALIAGQLPELKGKRVATILTGGNIDSTALGRAIERGMVFDHRLTRFNVVVSDRPGGVAELTHMIAECGASVKDIFMERAWLRQDVYSVKVKAIVETRNLDHVHELEKLLKSRYEDVYFTFSENSLLSTRNE